MSKMRIKSSLNPAIFRGEKFDRIVAGSIWEVNGEKWPHPYVAVTKGMPLSNIEWIRPAAPKPVAKQTKRVTGSSGKVYILERQPNGKWSCSCPGYQYRRFCKHTGAK